MEPYENFPRKSVAFWKDYFSGWNREAEVVLPSERASLEFLQAMEEERSSIDRSLWEELAVECKADPEVGRKWRLTRPLTVRQYWAAMTRTAWWMLYSHGLYEAKMAIGRLFVPGEHRWTRPVQAFMVVLNSTPSFFAPLMDDPQHDVSVSATALVAGHIALRAQLRSAIKTRLRRAVKSEGGDFEERLLEKLPSVVLTVWRERDPSEPCMLVVEKMASKAVAMVAGDLKSETHRAVLGLKTVSLESPTKELADHSGPSAEDLVLVEDTKAALRRQAALASFSPDETAVFELKLANPELSNAEIAKILGKPPNQIGQYVSRYRRKLRATGADRLIG